MKERYRLLKLVFYPSIARIIYFVNRVIKDRECTYDTKRCAHRLTSGNYQYQSYGADTPKCCANKLYHMLSELHEEFKEAGINYVCLYGTHLGQVRHGGLIPWDTDVDIGVPMEELPFVTSFLQKNFPSRHIVQEEWGYRINFSETNLLHIDIEFWHLDGNERVFDHDIYIGRRRLPANVFSDVTERQFGGIKAFFPADNEILTDIYGKDYRTIGIRKWCKIKSKKVTSIGS